MKKEYRKLVRDLIPLRVEKSGGKPELRTLSSDEFSLALREKFKEELNEYLSANTPEERLEEMADIFEVITALNEIEGRDIEQIVAVQKKKREERGGFSKRIFLESVEE